MVSKESSHLPSANNCGYNNPEQALTVRSVLLNRDSPDIESRLKRRRNRTQQVRFKDLDDGRPECLGRCRSVDEQGSPRPTRKSPPIVLLCSSKEVHERDVRWEKTTNGSSVVGAVRGDITKTIGAVAASLARTPPHPLTPGPTRRTWVPSGPSSLTPPTNPRACLSTAIQTSPSLQKTFPFPRVQNRSHSLGDFVYSDVQEDKSDRRTFPQKHVLTSGAAQDISVPYRNSLNYFTKHHEEDGLLAGSILESVDLGHGTSLLNSSPTHTVKASMGPHHATSPLQSQKQKLVRALSDPEKSQLTSTKAPELGLADITISKPRLAGTSNLETRLTDISDPHAGMNVQSISQSRQTKSYLPHTDMTSTPLPQYELSSFINAERVPSASSPHKTSLSCASVHHTVPPNTSLSNTNPICAPAVQIALPFSCPPRPTHTTQGDESERGERREPPLPPPPTPPPPYNPRPDGYRPLRLNGRPPASNSSSEHEKKTKVPPGSSEGLHIHPKKASYCLGQDPNPPPVGSPQSVPHHNQTYLEDTSASHTETYISSPGTNNNLHLHLMDQLPPSGPWVPILNRITDTPLTPDQAETLRHVQELLGGLMSGAQSKLHLDKLLGPSGALQNVGGLQTQLQSLEGILETSQNTIKVLLDVIQDLEKKEAERDGRHSYRTGQDIENCGTCRDCACIIYSVEHDFRLQEGQFTRAWRILDPPVSPRTAPSPSAASHVEKTPPAAQAPHAVKKKTRKCFWFL